jgi:transcriptional regulator with XRE-family HTH domain
MGGNRRFTVPEKAPPNFFAAWRRKRGMAQSHVEKEFGWPSSRLSNLENGRAIYTSHILSALANYYSCTPADLIGRPPPEGDEAAPRLTEVPTLYALVSRLQEQIKRLADDRVRYFEKLDAVQATANQAASIIGALAGETAQLAVLDAHAAAATGAVSEMANKNLQQPGARGSRPVEEHRRPEP